MILTKSLPVVAARLCDFSAGSRFDGAVRRKNQIRRAVNGGIGGLGGDEFSIADAWNGVKATKTVEVWTASDEKDTPIIKDGPTVAGTSSCLQAGASLWW
jgi:hypothetical protein